MDWSKPEILDVNMSAEIGAYQDDSGDRDSLVAVRESDDAAARELIENG